MATVSQLDLDRYMGTWYVIGHIPPFLTDDAYNAVESYSRGEDDRVEVLFTYNKGAFDGPAKTLTPTAFTNVGELPSEWGMRFIWPLKSDFRITYVDATYTFTIVSRNRRDYVWIMAREPIIADAQYQDLLNRVAGQGYDSAQVRKVPQQPRAERDDSAHTR
ncbi:MAG: lipocalin family protein [Pseudomonadales bacterium]